jgi:hypothetical protein
MPSRKTYFADYTVEQRKEWAQRGWALPDGSYPIANVAMLDAAIKTYGMGNSPKAEIKAHIIKRARALGATDRLPDGWTSDHADPNTDLATVTITDVELVKAGNWASNLSGRVPITGEDLDAMLAAATDIEIDSVPVKLGHIDPRFDGEPAYGWVRNMRRIGETLVADLTGVPSKLAQVVQSAFPRRSVEINWAVKTPSGRQYKASLAGVALLGVTPPAVKGLADIVALYSGDPNEADSTSVIDIIDGANDEAAVAQAAALSAMSHYAAMVDGTDAQAMASAAMALFSAQSGDLSQKLSQHGPDAIHPKPAIPKSEGPVNDEQVRTALGLAADFVVTDQLRKLAEDQTKIAEQAAADQAKAAADAKAEADRVAAEAKAKAEADALAANGGQPPVVTVDKAAFEQLQANAQAGAEAARILADQERERELTAALSGGKIAPASLDAYRKLWDTNKEQTRALLSGLPQVFSTTTAFSSAPSGTGGPGDTDAFGLTEADWKKALDNDFNLDSHGGTR